jgi:N utilization substance protein B
MTDDRTDKTTPQPGAEPDQRTATGKARARKRRGASRNRPGQGKTSVAATSTRHQSRILALQALYEYDLTGHDGAEIAERLGADEDVPPSVRDYAATVLTGVLGRREEIDALIAGAAPAFPVAQLSAVDRNVLRIAIYELMAQRKTVPVGVAINEAIEIAKNFGAEHSGKFVHGVLGTVSRQLPDDPAPARG